MKPKLCGLLGGKLGHSFSPQIHACLADYEYRLFPMPLCDVEGFVKSGEWDCLNVTIPYKEIVMPYLDTISDEAGRIGSVNTIVRAADGPMHGYNTDYYGFSYLVKTAGIDVSGKKCLILGSGGSSKTVRCVLADLGAGETVTISRTGGDNYGNVSRHCDADIIVNTTPVGMFPDTGKSAVELSAFPNCSGVIDLIYNPGKTKLLLDAERLGVPCANGLAMLVAQAKKACEIFTSQEIPDKETERITKRIAAQMRNIVLIGMPGCGKSSVGVILSEKLGRELIDTDRIIARSGRTPAEIIRSDGEPAFRDIEAAVVADAGKQSGKIIATGGGIVTRRENTDALRQNGIIFYLDRSLEKLDTSDRPLSQSSGVKALYEARLPLYRALCDYEIEGNGGVSEAAEKILSVLEVI